MISTVFILIIIPILFFLRSSMVKREILINVEKSSQEIEKNVEESNQNENFFNSINKNYEFKNFSNPKSRVEMDISTGCVNNNSIFVKNIYSQFKKSTSIVKTPKNLNQKTEQKISEIPSVFTHINIMVPHSKNNNEIETNEIKIFFGFKRVFDGNNLIKKIYLKKSKKEDIIEKCNLKDIYNCKVIENDKKLEICKKQDDVELLFSILVSIDDLKEVNSMLGGISDTYYCYNSKECNQISSNSIENNNFIENRHIRDFFDFINKKLPLSSDVLLESKKCKNHRTENITMFFCKQLQDQCADFKSKIISNMAEKNFPKLSKNKFKTIIDPELTRMISNMKLTIKMIKSSLEIPSPNSIKISKEIEKKKKKDILKKLLKIQ